VKQGMDHVESRGAGGPQNTISPDKNRVTTYRKAAEEAISQHRAGSRGANSNFASTGAPGAPPTNFGSNYGNASIGAPPTLGGPQLGGGARPAGPGMGPSGASNTAGPSGGGRGGPSGPMGASMGPMGGGRPGGPSLGGNQNMFDMGRR
jgi:hypothetical protein